MSSPIDFALHAQHYGWIYRSKTKIPRGIARVVRVLISSGAKVQKRTQVQQQESLISLATCMRLGTVDVARMMCLWSADPNDYRFVLFVADKRPSFNCFRIPQIPFECTSRELVTPAKEHIIEVTSIVNSFGKQYAVIVWKKNEQFSVFNHTQ
jgi:hypothetical protein